jgi:hypothetical protein
MTFNDIFSAALRLLGAIDPGEPPSASEAQDGFLAANNLLESWSTERLNLYALNETAYPLVTTQQVYTIGTGGNFNVARPVKIDSACVLVPTGSGPVPVRGGVQLISEAQWKGIRSRTATGTTPQKLYCDMLFPLANINLWPVPVFTAVTPQIELTTWVALLAFADLVTDNSFPPGYARAFIHALAIELAPEYPGQAPSPALIAAAQQSKDAIRALNASMPGAPPPDTAAQPPAVPQGKAKP